MTPSDAAAAFDGAAAAALYDAARPGYPAQAIEWALPGPAGTGKLTAALAGPGRRIIAVDRYVEQLASRSYVLNLPGPARQEALAHARDVAGAHAAAGQVIVRYRTTVLRARRRAPAPPG
jgi:hypothetical protein